MPAPLASPSPFFSSRPVEASLGDPPPPASPRPHSAAPQDACVAEHSRPSRVDDLPFYEPEEKLVLSIDIGNSFSSVTLTHLKWGSAPLSLTLQGSGTSAIRTVPTYPYSSPLLTPIPSRMPSLIYFDRHDRPRAHGVECLLPEVKERAREEGWVAVRSWKEQTRSAPTPGGALSSSSSFSSLGTTGGGGGDAKKLIKKAKPSALAPSRSAPSLGLNTPLSPFSLQSNASSSSEGLLDAIDVKTEIHGPSASSRASMEGRPALLGPVDGGSGALAGIGVSVKEKEKKGSKVYHGPKLATIYGYFLTHLVACARAWFSESTPHGEATFLRLWPTCVFVVATPADFSNADTDLIRQGMEELKLLPHDFKVGRLNFVRESAAVVHFAKRHTRDAEKTWLQEGRSFALCDAAEFGVSVIGYTVVSLTPRLKLRAYEPLSRLPSGADSVLLAFRALLTHRLAKTKFKASQFSSFILEEFRLKLLPKFTGLEKGEFKLRIQPEGGGDPKAEKWIDTGARVRDGWMSFSVRDIEDCFRPSVDSIIIRLSSTLPRGEARHILLSGGFGESPYLVRRLRETFEPHGTQLVIPNIPTHAAVSEGALRVYLGETLRPRRTRFALGVQSAVNWRTTKVPGAHERELYEGSGGQRLVLGRFSEVVPKGEMLNPERPWRKRFNFKYKLAAKDPVFSAQLWLYDPSASSVEGLEEEFDGWMTGLDGKPLPSFQPGCEVSTDLYSLVALSKVHGKEGKEWVQLEVDLVVYVGESSLEAAVVWTENGEEVRGPPSKINQQHF
ncbi:hypothetical protein JCM8547_006204 [Rhodosporidiobolus lusitaniae]